MDVQVAFYHGIRHNIRRVLDALGPERVDKGLTAFEDGASSWSECFFARALKDEVNLAYTTDPEKRICEILDFMRTDGTPNRVPIRLVWRTFDGNSKLIQPKEMKDLIVAIRDESRPDEVMELLRSIDYVGAEETPIVVTCG